MRTSIALVALALAGCTPKQTPDASLAKTAPAAAPAPAAEGPEAGAATGPDDDVQLWQVVKQDQFAVAVPVGWRDLDAGDKDVHMLRVGDGIGIPPKDETGEPLQAGMVVETRPGHWKDSSELADDVLATLQADKDVQMDGPPMREAYEMCDGRQGQLVVVSFERPKEKRKSLYTQVISTDDAGTGWVTSGYLISGPDSQLTSMDGLPAAWIAAHTLSFCLDSDKFSDMGLRNTYAALMQVIEEDKQQRAMEDMQKGEQPGPSVDTPTKAGTETPAGSAGEGQLARPK